MGMKLKNLEVDLLQFSLPRWVRLRDDVIKRLYHFASFNQGYGFMTLVSRKVEELHHRDGWAYVGSELELTLASGNVNGLSACDIALARFADDLFADCQALV